MGKAPSLSLIGGFAVITYLVPPLRFVRVDGVLYWTIRSWLWNYPVTANFDTWTISGRELEDFSRDRLRFVSMWSFLPPFFASKGYDLHVQADPSDLFSDLIPCPTAAKRTERPEYPFARCFYETDRDASFMFYVFPSHFWPCLSY